MLRDKMPCKRMQTPCEETRHQEIYQRAGPEEAKDDRVKDELDAEVEEVPLREGLCADEAGAEGVEEDLECAIYKKFEMS